MLSSTTTGLTEPMNIPVPFPGVRIMRAVTGDALSDMIAVHKERKE